MITAIIVIVVLLGGVATGAGVAQEGGPGNGPPSEQGPPDDRGPVQDPSLAVTAVTVDAGEDLVRLTVTNPGTQSVRVATAEFEAVLNETVVERVVQKTRPSSKT